MGGWVVGSLPATTKTAPTLSIIILTSNFQFKDERHKPGKIFSTIYTTQLLNSWDR